MSLNAGEFIRRFLQHLLPKGFHKVRFYGLLSPANRHRLAIGQNMLSDDSLLEPVAEVVNKDESAPDCTNMTCRFCDKDTQPIQRATMMNLPFNLSKQHHSSGATEKICFTFTWQCVIPAQTTTFTAYIYTLNQTNLSPPGQKAASSFILLALLPRISV